MKATEYSGVTGRAMKPCKRGYERNPATNRCRLKSTVVKPKPKPKAKAILKRTRGKTGAKTTVWCQLSQLQARRLILTVGLGRDLVARDLPTAKNPNKLCDTLTGMLKTSCTKGWKVTKFIAAGSYGHVYRAVKNDGTKAVMKVQVGSAKEIKHEVSTQRHFHRKGLAPKIIGFCSFKPKTRLGPSAHKRLNALVGDDAMDDVAPHAKGHEVHIILMEEIAGVVGDWLHPLKSKEQLGQLTFNIFDLVESMKKHKLTHADLHLWNLGYVYTDASKKHIKLMPIDFGRSVVGKANPELELGAILRILRSRFHQKGGENKPVPEFNRRVIVNLIRALSPRRFGVTFPKTLAEADDNFSDQLTRHMVKQGFW